jgi:hypothetical protein
MMAMFLLLAATASADKLPTPSAGLNLGSLSPRTDPVLSAWNFTGSMSLNWRNVGPRKPQFETQIQDEVYLADMYFGVYGPALDHVPFWMEFQMPTGAQGVPNLYQVYVQYDKIEDWSLQLGKFLVPFGRFNELYRPDMFLTVTRPLLYASPDSLDLVVRINSPRPPFSSGYSDIGARVSYYPPYYKWAPTEITAFIVNGMGEASNIQRTFPTPQNLGIPAPPANGTDIDFGHQNNNLADNNNNKAPGVRIVYSLGTLRLPWPIPEGKRDLNGMTLGFSAMGGQYDLPGELNYQVYNVDMAFEYQGLSVSAEYSYGTNQFLSPVQNPLGVLPSTGTSFHQDFEINQGYFVQASYPIWRHPPWGKRLTAIVVYNQLFHRGPQLDLFQNATVDGVTYPSIAAYNGSGPRVSTRMDKFTGALNYKMSDHFITKFEYSYWSLGRASTQSTTDIYQGALSFVVSF